MPPIQKLSKSKNMLYLLAPWLVAAIPSLIATAGAMIGRGQSRGDIARQNAYNDPSNQVARLRRAGLPMAAMEGGHAGTQSTLPETSGDKIGSSIGSFISNQTQLLQMQLLKEEIRLKGSEADRNEAERDWLLSGRGEDISGTNLTSTLKTKLGIEQAQMRGHNLTNIITQAAADNARTRTRLDNTKIIEEITNLVVSRGLTGEHIKGAAFDNNIKRIISEYQKGMSEQAFTKLVLENIGQANQNDISEIRSRIEQATETSQIFEQDMKAAMSSLSYDRVKAEFENYNQYQEFVQRVQDHMNKTAWERIKDPMATLQAMIDFAYTSVTGLSGQGQMGNSILNFMK